MTRSNMPQNERPCMLWRAAISVALIACLTVRSAPCQSTLPASRPVKVEFGLAGFPERWAQDLNQRLTGLAAKLQETMYMQAPWLAHWQDKHGRPVNRVLRVTLTMKGRIVPKFHLQYEFDGQKLIDNQPLPRTTSLSANTDKLASTTQKVLDATFSRVSAPSNAKPLEQSFYPKLRRKVSIANRVLMQHSKCIVPVSFRDLGIRDQNDPGELARKARFRIFWHPNKDDVEDFGVPYQAMQWRFNGWKELDVGDRGTQVPETVWGRYASANGANEAPYIYARIPPREVEELKSAEVPSPDICKALHGQELNRVTVEYLPPLPAPKREAGNETLDNPTDSRTQ